VCFFVLINRTPTGFFNISWPETGDLFLLLFVVVMEHLSIILSAIVDRRLLSGFLMGSRNNEELLVSHLLFVNDALIFVKQIQIIYFICSVFSYALKLSWG
jgi:hypothetical protein